MDEELLIEQEQPQQQVAGDPIDTWIDKFYSNVAKQTPPQDRTNLKNALKNDFDRTVTRMYDKYAPGRLTPEKISTFKSKLFNTQQQTKPSSPEQRLDNRIGQYQKNFQNELDEVVDSKAKELQQKVYSGEIDGQAAWNELQNFTSTKQKEFNDEAKRWGGMYVDQYKKETGVNEQPSKWDAAGNVIESVDPLGKSVYDFGRTIYSGLTDTAPQAVAQTMEVAKTSLNPSNIDEYIKNKIPVDFQNYVRKNDPQYKGLSGFFTAFDMEKALPKYGTAFMEENGLAEEIGSMEKKLPEVIGRRKALEEYVAKQKGESGDKLAGVVQDFRDIKDPNDLLSYISGMAGQAAYQIPLSVATKGGSSYIMEASTIYDKQLDNLAAQYGISRQEVIDRNLDDPAAGQAYAVLAAGLDATSAGNLLGLLKKSAGTNAFRTAVQKVAPTLTEATTEATQGVLEDVGAGGTVSEALKGEGLASRINEFLGGAVGGSLFSFSGKKKQAQIADEAIQRISDIADPSIIAEIDAAATFTPEEEKMLKIKQAEKQIEELSKVEKELASSEQLDERQTEALAAFESKYNRKPSPDERKKITDKYKIGSVPVSDKVETGENSGSFTFGQREPSVDETVERLKQAGATPEEIAIVIKDFEQQKQFGNRQQLSEQERNELTQELNPEGTVIKEGQLFTRGSENLDTTTPPVQQTVENEQIAETDDDSVKIDDLAKRIAAGEKSFTAEDLQIQANYSQDIENRLQAYRKPEYKQAVEKVESLSKLLADPAVTEQQERDYYRQLLETKAALRQIAPAPKSKGKTGIQKQIEDASGITKEKSVKMTPLKQREYEIKAIDFGVKLGRDLTQEQVVAKITQAAKDAKLSPKQIQTLSKSAERVSLTPKSIEKFSKLVNNVVTDADYAEKLSIGRNNRKVIRNASRSKNRSIREKTLLKQFSKIKPEEVTSINEYNDLASSITQALKPSAVPMNLELTETRMRDLVGRIYQEELQAVPKANSTVDEMIAELESKRETDKETDRLQKLADNLDVDIEEARLLDESEEEMSDKAKKEKLRQSYIQQATGKKITVDKADLTKLQKQDVDAINNIDPSLLTTQQLKNYITIVDRINENNDFGMSGPLAAIGKAQEGWIKLKKHKFNVLPLTWLEEVVDSQPQAIEAILGMPKDAAMFQLYSGIKGMTEAGSVAIKESEAYADFIGKLQKKLPKAFTDESMLRQGIYQELIRHPESWTADEAMLTNKELVNNSIARRKAEGGNQEVKEAKIEDKLFSPFRGAKTMDDVKAIMQRIDPQGKKLIEEMIDYHDTHKIAEAESTLFEFIQSDNERFENKSTESVSNYGAPRVWRKIGDQEILLDDIKEFDDTTFNVRKPKQINAGKSLTMRDRERSVLDFNVHKNSIDNVQKLILRGLAKPYQWQLRNFISNEADLRELFGAKQGNPESNKRANAIIQALFKKTSKSKNERLGIVFTFENDLLKNGRPEASKLVSFVGGLLNILKGAGYAVTLSGYTQAPKQSTVLANVVRQLGTNVGLLQEAIAEYKDAKDNDFYRGETVGTRGELTSLLNVNQFYNASSRLAQSNAFNKFLETTLPAWSNKAYKSKWGGVGVLTSVDANMAQISYLAFYKQYLKDRGVKFEGIKKEVEKRDEEVRKEARAFAKQRIDTLQVVSNPAEQSEFFKTQGLLPEVARAWFVPYGGFAASAKSRLFNDYKMLMLGNSKQRDQAMRDIQATFIEQLAFNAVSQSVKLLMYGGVGMLMREMFDLEDEETWEEWWAKTKKLVNKDMLFATVPITLGSVGENMVVDAINEVYFSTLQAENPDLTKREYEEEYAPLARFKNFDQGWYDYIGPYGASFAKVADALDAMEDSNNEDLPPAVQKLADIVFFSQLLQSQGMAPADIVNALKGEYLKQKRAATAVPPKSQGKPSKNAPSLKISPRSIPRTGPRLKRLNQPIKLN